MHARGMSGGDAGAVDSHHATGETVGSAIESVKQGAIDAQDRARGAMPVVGQFVSQVVYTSCYGLSYGIIFPVMLAVHWVPKENALVHGLVDGAIAARDQLDGWNRDEMAAAAEKSADGDEPESDQSHDGKTSRRRQARRRGGSNKGSRPARS